MNNDDIINFRLPKKQGNILRGIAEENGEGISVLMREAVALLLRRYGIEPKT